eukprot:gb/GECG01011649.1/.p1 GENE.gb/GECG01011649.1/~~gb/GECG01011649.1/.p1  ORF type:complete len:1406 (+),score=151.16 gb/GECG01011649.1/:1-4218(+)
MQGTNESDDDDWGDFSLSMSDTEEEDQVNMAQSGHGMSPPATSSSKEEEYDQENQRLMSHDQDDEASTAIAEERKSSSLMIFAVGLFVALLFSLVLGVLFGHSHVKNWVKPPHSGNAGHKQEELTLVAWCHPKKAEFPVFALRRAPSLSDFASDELLQAIGLDGARGQFKVVAYEKSESPTRRYPTKIQGVNKSADWRFDRLSDDTGYTPSPHHHSIPWPMPIAVNFSQWTTSFCESTSCKLESKRFYADNFSVKIPRKQYEDLHQTERNMVKYIGGNICGGITTPNVQLVDHSQLNFREETDRLLCRPASAVLQLEALEKGSYDSAFSGPCHLSIMNPIGSVVIMTDKLQVDPAPSHIRTRAENAAELDITTAHNAVRSYMKLKDSTTTWTGGSIWQPTEPRWQWPYESTFRLNSAALVVPELGMDEEYSLELSHSHEQASGDPSVMRINAASIWGLTRASSSMRQLYRNTDALIDFPEISVVDSPRFPWRGVSVDTARHFLPVPKLKALIDSMAMSKFNTLHWHLVDSQSFPLLVRLTLNVTVKEYANFFNWARGYISQLYSGEKCPAQTYSIPASSFVDSPHPLETNLTLQGNFTAPWSRSKVYSESSINYLVRYGALRGIRIVPEMDVPSHAGGWGCAFARWALEGVLNREQERNPNGFPSLSNGKSIDDVLRQFDGVPCPYRCNGPTLSIVSPCHGTVRSDDSLLHGMNKYALDPSLRITYDVVQKILGRVQDLFPDKWMHLGGDEVAPECWGGVDHIHQWALRKRDTTSLRFLWNFFTKSILSHIRKNAIVWQDAYDELGEPIQNPPKGLGKTVAVQTWKCWAGMDTNAAMKAASNWESSRRGVIRSSCWYLDWETSWHQVYKDDPWPHFSGRMLEAPLLVNSPAVWGGEAAIWTEHIDSTNVGCKSFPRSAAVGERLWSSRLRVTTNDTLRTCDDGVCTSRVEVLRERATMQNNISYTLGRLSVFRDRIDRETELHPSRMVPANDKHHSKTCTKAISQGVQWALRPQDVLNYTSLSEKFHSLPYEYYSPSFSEGLRSFHTVISFNVADGGRTKFPAQVLELGNECQVPEGKRIIKPRLCEILLWLRQREADVAALVELNNWDQGEEDVPEKVLVTKYMQENAAFAGYAHSVLLRANEGYHMGVMSRQPIQVLFYDTTNFERGALVVEIDNIVYVVAHLHAHSSQARLEECRVLAKVVTDISASGKPILMLGDMNTLSPNDQAWHQQAEILPWLRKKAPRRFSKKHGYILQSGLGLPEGWSKAVSTDDIPDISINHDSAENELNNAIANRTLLDYRPMHVLLDCGLQDLCSLKKWPEESAERDMEKKAPSPCDYTEPTDYSLVETIDASAVPPFRLDYGLANNPLLAKFPGAACTVVQTRKTAQLSDHYPIECRWRYFD